MKPLSDLELVRACAEAMSVTDMQPMCQHCDEYSKEYNPLIDDAQAMALVKKLRLSCVPLLDGRAEWHVEDFECQHWATNPDLNRAICICVAQLK